MTEMEREIVFKTMVKVCPLCRSGLHTYKTERRTVKSVNGSFVAVHKIMKCRNHETRFKSELLHSIIEPYCTYANTVMIEGSMRRFIDGRSGEEIAVEMNNGISGRHVRRLSNTALDIFPVIHAENSHKIRSAIKSYILQIDGTTDSEFAMIVVVRDLISGFILLVKRCYSESHQSIMEVLKSIREKFDAPSGITCDMRSGIISAVSEVFPGIPVRICLMHFLRDLGKDLLQSMHTDLGIMINRKRIKYSLKSILREMPDHDQKTLDEIGVGYASDRDKVETMAIRHILEKLIGSTGSSGFGFPFSLKHMNFYLACMEAKNSLAVLSGKIVSEKGKEYIKFINETLAAIIDNDAIRTTGKNLGSVNALFQSMRRAFKVPCKGKLSDELPDDDSIHNKCRLIIKHMNVFLRANIPNHIRTAARIIVDRYHKREAMLFANNSEHTIPRTNNGMERFFRKLRRNVRKRTGNTNTGNILTQSGDSLALFQNMGNPNYVKIVFDSRDIASEFAKYRKPFMKKDMTVQRKRELVKKGTEMLMNDSLSDTVYTPEVMEKAKLYRGSSSTI